MSDGSSLVIDGTTRPTVDIRAGTTAFGNPGITGANFTTLLPIPNTTAPATSASINIGSLTVTSPGGLVFLTNQYQPNPALTGNIQVTNIRVNDRDGDFSGNGGDVIIDSRGDITLPNSGRIQTSSGTGNAGNVTLIANGLFLMNPGSQIQAVTEGRGNAGNVTMKIDGAVTLLGNLNQIGSTDGTAIYTNVEREAVGNGGDLTIDTRRLVTRNAEVSTGAGLGSSGRGGNLLVKASDSVEISGLAGLSTSTQGPGGNITIKSPAFLADLFFSRKATPVGRNPGSFAQFRGNGRVDISADSQTGTSGTVSLPTIDPTRGLTQLPTDLVDAERLIDRRCTPSKEAQKSSFIVTGRGGLPPSPNEPLRGEAVIADWITLDAEPEKRDRPNPTPNPTSATPNQLVEAQGWVIGPNGQVILTAQAPTVTPQNPRLTLPPCQDSQTTTK